VTKEQLLELIGDFTWDFGSHFFIETDEGNFSWHDPDYGGDNTIERVDMCLRDWLGDVPYGRAKGRHRIGGYCGEDIIWRETNDED